MTDCVKRIVETSKGQIKQGSARHMLRMVDEQAKRLVADGFEYDSAVRRAVDDVRANTTRNIKRQRKNMAKNVVIKASIVGKISALVHKGLSIKDAIRAYLEGISSHIEGARDSLAMRKSAVEHGYFSRFIGELNREGLLPVLNSSALDDEIGRELWALSAGKGGVAKNKQAKQIADIIFKTRDSMRKRQNEAGADITQVEGYVMPQRHDTHKMFKAGEEKWVKDMTPLLDKKRSFGGDYESLEAAMRAAYRAMVSGTRLNDPLDVNPKLFQFDGPENLAKSVSQSRQLHFKDYDSWDAWNNEYGMRGLNEGVIDAIRYDANNIALMERFGTNPEAMLKAVIAEIKRMFRDKIAKEGELGIDKKVQDMIDAALGKDMMAAHPTVARVGTNIRAFNNVTMLGGAVISSLTDIPMKSLEYKFQGKSWLSSTVQPFLDIAQGLKSKKDRIEFASLTGVGFESMIADIGGRFSAQDNLSNKAAKVQRIFFKLNGLAWWTDSHKNAMGRVMSHDLGLKQGVAFADLDKDTRRLFGNFNIKEADWDIARKSVTTMEDGRSYIFPNNIENQAVREKLIGYFVDRSDIGVPTPGAREQRIATLGTQRGTAVGEAVRLLMQFKSFPITVVTKVWGRALYGKGKADIPAMAYLMLQTMAFGYMAQAAKDLVKGRTPKDPTRVETAFAALGQGGGAGILGDILLADGAGFGRSATQIFSGPTFGRFDDLFKIYSAGVRGGGSKAQIARTAISAVPFNNLFYTRAALENLLIHAMMEDLNPGYLRRMERNMNRTYGQQLLFK